MNMMSISIIIPTYNRSEILPQTLDSVLSQTYNNWKCLVIDDHSTDNTKRIIQDYCDKDNRIRYLLNNRKKGAQGARNTGLYESDSEWIFFFDSDNIMHPDLLETLLAETNTGIDVCKCFSNVIDTCTGKCISQQNWIANGDISRDLFDGRTYVDFNQEIIRRSKLLEIGGLDEDCPSLQEFDTNIRLSRICYYHTVEKALVDYCIGGNDTISANYRKQVKGKFYNLSKFKKDWLVNKHNADRSIYELYDKLKKVNSCSFRIGYAIRTILTFYEMIPFYARKILKKIACRH